MAAPGQVGSLRRMQIMVTGAAGLVGRQLVPHLERAGHSVASCDLAGCAFELNVADPISLAGAVAEIRPDAVIHLAAISATRNPDDDPADIFRINFGGTANLFDAVEAIVPKARVLFISSGLIYGPLNAEQHAADETAPLQPRGAYGWSKAAGDRLAEARADAGLDIFRVRPFNHTGWGRREDFVESRLAKQIVEIERGEAAPQVHASNVAGTRDFLDVSDVVEAYLRLLDPAVPKGAYNVASGTGRTIQEIWDRMIALSPTEAELVIEPQHQDGSDRSIGDATRLKSATGWAPSVEIDHTLAQVLRFWRETLATTTP